MKIEHYEDCTNGKRTGFRAVLSGNGNYSAAFDLAAETALVCCEFEITTSGFSKAFHTSNDGRYVVEAAIGKGTSIAFKMRNPSAQAIEQAKMIVADVAERIGSLLDTARLVNIALAKQQVQSVARTQAVREECMDALATERGVTRQTVADTMQEHVESAHVQHKDKVVPDATAPCSFWQRLFRRGK